MDAAETEIENNEYFYIENDNLPVEGEIVVVKFQTVTDYGSKVNLLTHNNIEAFMPINEYSNRRLRTMNYTRVGKVDIMCVSRVDVKKCHIDVSRKQITEEDRVAALDKFKRELSIRSVLKYSEISDLYSFFKNIAYESAIDMFELFKRYLFEQISLPNEIKNPLIFIEMCQKYMRIEKVDTKRNIYLFAFGIDAIDDIKTVLSCVKNHNIKLIYNTPPYYTLQSSNQIDIQNCLDEMMETSKIIEDLEFKIFDKPIPEEEEKNEFEFSSDN